MSGFHAASPLLMRSSLLLYVLIVLSAIGSAYGQATISGVAVDRATDRPLEYIAVVLKGATDDQMVASTATDSKGQFTWENIPFGKYRVTYAAVGQVHQETPQFTVNAQRSKLDLGRLMIGNEEAVQLEKMQVIGRKEAFSNSIDRKIYNVGKDLQSAAGSASDLLQNVPAVQVDIEGNVSLRGSSNVLILVNGRSSVLMGRNRAATLEQLPADGIERIEVITNPSAKYKPDGTAGIINLVLKRKPTSGYSASVRANIGNGDRYNVSSTLGYNPGRYNVHGTFGLRQDERVRDGQETRMFPDPVTGVTRWTEQSTTEQARPLSRLAQAGIDYTPVKGTTLGASFNYNYRDFRRTAVQRNTTRDVNNAVISDYERRRDDPEFEEDIEFGANLSRAFAAEGRELSLEVKRGRTTEEENNRYTNRYFNAAIAATSDRTLIHAREDSTEASADYVHPLGRDAKLEAGYSGLFGGSDADFRVSNLDALTGAWVPDTTRSNRFLYDSSIHALYATYGHHWGNFGALGGLRYEQAQIDTNQVTAGLVSRNDYSRTYPTLHLTYDLPNSQQLQLNYSHRVRRPESDDLNPYPEYQDPFNLRAGNPQLQPEQIHSVEGGWQFKQDDTTYLATAYHRYRYNGITEVIRFIDGGALLTTKENLAVSRASGIELGVSRRWQQRIALNFSGNIYRNEIDAGNLGFSTSRIATAWDAKINLGWDVSKATLVQLNANYTAKRLTPQGYRHPTAVVNIGVRHDFADKKTAVVATVSDVFNSLKERTFIDTPGLRSESTRRRSSRIVYVGLIYNFGRLVNKAKDELTFDNAP